MFKVIRKTNYSSVYDLNINFDSHQSRALWRCIWSISRLEAVVAFTSEIAPASHADEFKNEAPFMVHSAKTISPFRSIDSVHIYSVSSSNFVLPGHEHYQAGPASVAHTRSLGFLKQHLGGPIFDLEAIWDEHTLFEFGERNVEKTMSTMVDEPYVNHVPTV